jgi:hypothetical protein
MTTLALTGRDLTLDVVLDFEASRPQVTLTGGARERMRTSADTVGEVLDN